MSTPIIAVSISLAKGLKKTPVWNTVLQKVAAGRGNSAVSLAPYPVWEFELDMDHITGNEAAATSVIAQFLGVYMQTQGSAGLFLFVDPQDSTVTQNTGVMLNVTPGAASPMSQIGDGVSTQFQLSRLIGASGVDIIQNLNGAIVAKVNGSTAAQSVSSTGVVTFSVAPANGATITWAGSFYFLCRFDSDSLDAVREFTRNTGTDNWSINSIKFASEFV